MKFAIVSSNKFVDDRIDAEIVIAKEEYKSHIVKMKKRFKDKNAAINFLVNLPYGARKFAANKVHESSESKDVKKLILGHPFLIAAIISKHAQELTLNFHNQISDLRIAIRKIESLV